jgi:dihydropteroate synthase
MGKREDFLREGFDLSRCWLDPGFGFGKTVGLQWRMVESMAQLVRAWSPVRVWVGHSRKSFLDDGPPSWRAWWLRGDENLWYRRDRQTSCLSRWFDGCGVGAVRVHAPWVESMDEEYDHATSDFSFDVWSSAS